MKKLVTIIYATFVMLDLTEGASGAPVEQAYRSELEKNAVLSQMRLAWTSLDRIAIEFETRSQKRLATHKLIAITQHGEFYERLSHFTEAYSWEEDPLAQEFVIRNGKTQIRWPVVRAYMAEQSINVGDFIPGSVWMDVLLSILPKWPLTQYTLPNDPRTGVPILPMVALTHSDFHLRKEAQNIAGVDCYVFERLGAEKIWVSQGQSFCIVQREKYDRNSGRLVHRVSSDSLKEIAPGLCFPRELRTQVFNTHHHDVDEHAPVTDATVSIKRVLVNQDVPQKIFELEVLPGAIHVSNDWTYVQVAQGGEDLIETMAGFLKKNGLPTHSSDGTSGYGLLLSGLAAGVLLAFAGTRTLQATPKARQ